MTPTTNMPPGAALVQDVLPIFLSERGKPPKPLDACGTGFLIADRVLVACWHCVRAPLDTNRFYAVAEWNGSSYIPRELTNITQVAPLDLATANVDMYPRVPLKLSHDTLPIGADVYTFGYPLTTKERRLEGDFRFRLQARYLQGYVTRSFDYEPAGFGTTATYELDMPAPAGISGAPLLTLGSTEVVGVVYGSSDVATVEELARVDAETGARTPEIQRIVSFGLAHHTETLWELSSLATGGRSLSEILH